MATTRKEHRSPPVSKYECNSFVTLPAIRRLRRRDGLRPDIVALPYGLAA
jgi:hypothetical protein